MKARRITWIWLLVLVGTTCGKKDILEPVPPAVEDDGMFAAFFNRHQPTDPLLQSFRGFIMRQNEKYHFVNKFSNAVGIPVWNKSLVYSRGASLSGTSEDSIVAYVPFVKGESKEVYSAWCVRIKNGDTTCRMLYKWQYKPFELAAKGWKGKDVFRVFSLLN